MGFKFNPLFPILDLTGSGGGGGGYPGFKAPLTEPTLPLIGNGDGDFRVTTDTDYAWTWDATTSRWINIGVKPGLVGSSPNSNAYSIVDVNVGLNRSERQLQLQPADATNPGLLSISAQNITGLKTFSSAVYANSGLDVTATAGTDTLAIGTSNADIINIGRSGITINLIGATINQTVTNLNVTDKNITLNSGGAVGSGSAVGIEVEENAIITGYVETSGDRNSWVMKAPNTTGIITFTPGVAGFTIDQGSHNAVTLAAVGSSPNANGATLNTQILNLEPASAGFPGVVTTLTQTFAGNKTFNNNLIVVGSTTLATTLTGPLRATAGLVSTGNINLASEVTGILPIANGGTNSSTALNNNRIIISSAGSIIEAAALVNGQLLIGSTGASPVAANITGTPNQIIVTNGAGSIALSTPQNIDTGASPTFLGLTLTSLSTGIVKSTVGVLSSSAVNLASADVSGILPIANGGTNSSTVLNNDRIMISSAGSIIEATALLNGQLLIGSTGSSPVAANLTAGTGISIINGAGTINISTSLAPSPGDIAETSFSISNNTSNQDITGFLFSNAVVRAFRALVSIFIDDGGSGFYANYELDGIQKSASWELSQTYLGDTITGTSFNITSAGQVRITTGNIAGFVSGIMKFRAITVST